MRFYFQEGKKKAYLLQPEVEVVAGGGKVSDGIVNREDSRRLQIEEVEGEQILFKASISLGLKLVVEDGPYLK